MTKATVPTRTAFSVDGSLFWEGEHRHGESCDLITTTQAEAYKDACVREALEKAALAIGEPTLVEALIENFAWVSAENHARAHQILTDAKQIIRALTPPQQ